jgi:hypothetical protein
MVQFDRLGLFGRWVQFDLLGQLTRLFRFDQLDLFALSVQLGQWDQWDQFDLFGQFGRSYPLCLSHQLDLLCRFGLFDPFDPSYR